mmetsp:Transcript_8867/g.19028  ORF Transcript_8867/g.19028 Transcript_8867/m.19028 type:complete len:376 (-) Transcript_8867:183-1310(-)|eukprot:CAMPEP_0178477046 /NCGR_PEP_ID=MMETSP0696-20121128/3934_1 /TAXON_ID=265572 /ORGANISM="Extubocellulus spinifer, Strain CCMP396" /LENGTH=375 /DNA_ID=CAMNT_0020104355 /DNA_START=119 /DNA_END=1246 /DNA_ORIENTATION=-
MRKYILIQLGIPAINAFATPSASRHSPRQRGVLPVHALVVSSPSSSSSQLGAAKLSDLPKGINPFEKSLSKSLDIQADFRDRAKRAVDAAIKDDLKKLEIEFPPLIGGDKSKSQYDDFDNIQELDKNKDWTMLFAPMFLGKEAEYGGGKTWLVFPDLKECEIARAEWAGSRYQTATFTDIEAATNHLVGEGSYDAPWGSALVSGVSKIMGGADGDAGLLGDQNALDTLVEGENSPATLALVIQPGNGGPVEDWVNCEKIFNASPDTVMVVINGALDKVRGGYYPGVFFPKLAKTVDRFWKTFESVYYLKPISDKGCFGWLYRVYPEPWQVVLQTRRANAKGGMYVEDTVVYVSEERPEYNDAVAKLVAANAEMNV